MKAVIGLALLTGALAAPTPTLNVRSYGDLSSLDARTFADLIPNIGSDSSKVDLPDIGSFLSALGGSSTTAKAAAASTTSGGGDLFGGLFGGSMTENDVSSGAACQPLTFIFARGTTEFGNMGTVVGPPVAKALRAATGVNVQGVDYPASAFGNAALGGEGGPEMASLVQKAKSQCPKTKIVLGGYSQGAMVVHNAASKIDSGSVVGAVTFGDPFKALPPNGIKQFKTFCADGDPVCANGFNVLAHLSYGGNADEAAKFLLSAAGL